MIKHGHHGDHHVHETTDNGRREDDVGNGVVDGEQGDDKARQEQEHGNVKKGGDGFYGEG